MRYNRTELLHVLEAAPLKLACHDAREATRLREAFYRLPEHSKVEIRQKDNVLELVPRQTLLQALQLQDPLP